MLAVVIIVEVVLVVVSLVTYPVIYCMHVVWYRFRWWKSVNTILIDLNDIPFSNTDAVRRCVGRRLVVVDRNYGHSFASPDASGMWVWVWVL